MHFPTWHFLQTAGRRHIKELIVLIVAVVGFSVSNLFFVQGSSRPAMVINPKINDATCRSCHQEIYDSFIHTAHFHDSAPADSNSIKGSFEEGRNVFQYNPFMEVVMLKDGNNYRQSARINGTETHTAWFDIVIGSGKNGQTYLYWRDNQLFQLPVSYYRPAGAWCNSPGFPNVFFFDRQIRPNCLECHTTYTKVLSAADDKFEFSKDNIVYGISCSKCHPGGQEHVAFHTAHPDDTASRYVVNAGKLTRQLRMDACALCHSGLRKALRPPFSFHVGDSLDKFSIGKSVSQQGDTLDVHANQIGLLAASQCYINSVNMDCSTCHDVHRRQVKMPAYFSQKCMSCHDGLTSPQCTVNVEKNIVLSDNCIDCHMPVRGSRAITLNVKGSDEMQPDFLRSHYISVYKNATADFIKKHQPK